MDLTAEEIITRLGLRPLDQEGGFFRRTFTSDQVIGCGDARLDGPDRPLSTVILFLITPDNYSALHRLPSAEIWFFHLGDPIEMLLLQPQQEAETRILGHDLRAGHLVQTTVPPGCWQGCRLLPGARKNGFALCSAAVSPGFDWADFELGKAENLLEQWPNAADCIRPLIRPETARGSLE